MTDIDADAFVLSGLTSLAEWRALSPETQAALERAGQRRIALVAALAAKAARSPLDRAEVLSVIDGGVTHREVLLDHRVAESMDEMGTQP